MNIKELVDAFVANFLETNGSVVAAETAIRAAHTEQAETHAIELRAYETTVQNLEQRIQELEAALEIIAGRKQCIDNTMGNADVAIAALAAAPKKEGE